MKSGKVIFNLDESQSEYKNNKEISFQHFSEKFETFSPSSSIAEENDPFEREYLDSLLENQQDISENSENELTSGVEEEQYDLHEMGKISHS